MNKEKKHQAYAWGISAVLHVILFVLVALTGLFVRVSAEPDKTIDVAVYEVEQGAGSSGAAGAVAAAGEAAAEVVSYTAGAAVPEIAETYTRQPEMQQVYKEQKQRENAASAANSAGAAGAEGTGPAGTAGGEAAGGGTGNGLGQAADGQGAGQGTGEKDAVAAKRPAVPPRLLSGANPVYPEDLRRQGVEGAVRVRVVVGRDGSVEAASVAVSSGYGTMDAAAVAAAYSYRFAPALNVYDEPVRCAVSQTVQFRLQ